MDRAEALLRTATDARLTQAERDNAVASLRRMAQGGASGVECKAAREALTQLGESMAHPLSEFDGPSLARFIPEPEKSAYYRSREWLAAIPVSGRIAKVLATWHVETLADLELATVEHLKEPKLTAIWSAAQRVLDCEYRIDFARKDSESWTRLVMQSDLSGARLAAHIVSNLEQARAAYKEVAE